MFQRDKCGGYHGGEHLGPKLPRLKRGGERGCVGGVDPESEVDLVDYVGFHLDIRVSSSD